MRFLLNAGTGFVLAAWLLGAGPFAGPPDPHWNQVKADLAAARPQARLALQAEALFPAGLPFPTQDKNRKD